MLWYGRSPTTTASRDPTAATPRQRPLRIAWLGHASGRRADGLTSYSREVVTALERAGLELCFFSFRRDGAEAPVQRSVQLGSVRFKTVTIPAPSTLTHIERELDRFRPHVLHLSLSHSLLDASVLQRARTRGIATVVTVHLPYAPVGSSRGRVLFGLYRFHARALCAADRCIALSEDQRDLLLSVGCDPARIEVLGNGVDTAAITPGPSTLRGELGAAFVVTYLGRLDPEKRVTQLVEAFLRQQWPMDHMLLIAGAGTREDQIRRMIRGAPQVRLLGQVHNRAACVDLLRGTDVFVLPSTAEGLSLSLLEAMAAGCAVIATDVAEDGIAVDDAGIRIPREPLEPALGESLARLRDDADLRASLGRRARVRVCAAYSLQARVDAVMRMYAELCGTAAPASGTLPSHDATAARSPA